MTAVYLSYNNSTSHINNVNCRQNKPRELRINERKYRDNYTESLFCPISAHSTESSPV